MLPTLAAGLTSGCRTPTQVTVEITTTVACAESPDTAISVGRLGEDLESRPIAGSSTACDATGRVGSLVLVPSGDKSEQFAVKVVLARAGKPLEQCLGPTFGAGCIVARRALRFIPHSSLALPVAMRASCDNVDCPPDETCVDGTCRNATVPDPEMCAAPDGCPETVLGPGAPIDAGADVGDADTKGDSKADVGDSEADAGGSCTDQQKNGNETDTDCGGADCPKCAPARACEHATDCDSGVCQEGTCAAPRCGDGVVNGSDVCDGNCPCDDKNECTTDTAVGCDGTCNHVLGVCGAPGCGACPSVSIRTITVASHAYKIDTRETTNAEYARFLSAKPIAQGLPAVCSWKISFVPASHDGHNSSAHIPCPSSMYDPAKRATYPVECVDWCDAYAYCKWARKRLCGKVGGGKLSYAEFDNKSTNEWYIACSAGGTRKYAYGDSWDWNRCVSFGYDGKEDYNPSTDHAVPVGSATACEGGYSGLFDMTGNVFEWYDACMSETGHNDICRTQGGGFNSGYIANQCGYGDGTWAWRDWGSAQTGIRCCSD
jgi:formylglycine-generating enzyme required for sulfatase activity